MKSPAPVKYISCILIGNNNRNEMNGCNKKAIISNNSQGGIIGGYNY